MRRCLEAMVLNCRLTDHEHAWQLEVVALNCPRSPTHTPAQPQPPDGRHAHDLKLHRHHYRRSALAPGHGDEDDHHGDHDD